MTDGMICDRCGTGVSRRKWSRGVRAAIMAAETSRDATAYNPSEWELCNECAEKLYEFMGICV